MLSESIPGLAKAILAISADPVSFHSLAPALIASIFQRLSSAPVVQAVTVITALLALISLPMLFIMRRSLRRMQDGHGSSYAPSSPSPLPVSIKRPIHPIADSADEEVLEVKVPLPPPDIPPGLVDAIAHGSALMMVGSTAMVRDHAPTWKDFLEELSWHSMPNDPDESSSAKTPSAASRTNAAMARLLARDETDSVVDLIESMIGREALARYAGEAFRNATPTPGLAKLCALDWNGFVSTGIDDSARRAIGSPHVVTARSEANFEQFVRMPERFLLQLSGEISQPGTLSLTQAQLKEVIAGAPDLRSLLLSFFSSRTILFVGMRFDEIEFLLDAVGIFSLTPSKHYALIDQDPDFELIAERASMRYQIELLQVDGADGLLEFADRLEAEVGARDHLVLASDSPAPINFISKVKLTNIGPFTQASVQLDPGWTIILGNNGAGKSTLLRAIALILAGTDAQALPYARSLLKRGKKSGSIELTINTVPQPSTYKAQLLLEGDRVNLNASVSPLQGGSIAAFGFSAVRGVPLGLVMEPLSLTPQPLPRVSDILPLLQSGVDSRSQDLRAWIKQTYAVHQDSAVAEDRRQLALSRIDTFFAIVDDMAPGFDLRFSRCDSQTGEILLKTSDGEIPMDYVSQGMSSMIGWVGTLIQRLFEIHDDQENPTGASGILLIDEIDSHLHPEWQQRLVPALRRHFPNLQVIATTHSALMVGSLEAREVIKVERDGRDLRIERLDKSYKGYRFDQILTDDAFNLASARDQDWEDLRREYAGLLGKSKRTAKEEARYLELDRIIDSAPPPFESKEARDAYEVSRAEVDKAIRAGSDDGDVPHLVQE